MNHKHYVSAKAALYSADRQKVLIMKYSHGQYGLPGGHLDAREHPDTAIARELMEELSIDVGPLKRVDFFLRSDPGSSVILAYAGTVSDDLVLAPTHPDHEFGVWMSSAELQQVPNIAPPYKKFVLENWPK
jgi:8-oxo-dGTP pyrophosphatase MutT (NUDIX family)